jgi:transposase
MSTIETIRALDAQGVSGRQIAARLGVSRDSVAKYVSEEDFSPQPPVPVTRPDRSVLAGLTDQIQVWLTEDLQQPRKQRHTATRVFHRLRAEHGYQGSYSPVQRFVKEFKAHHRTSSEGFLELVWPAGTAQVDFGQAEAIISGIPTVVHVLVVTYPHSNMRFGIAYRGETAECVCDGLRRIFEYAGTAARTLVFDNATGAGRRTVTKVVESKLFAAFKAHYRIGARYCNPESGNEKGSVENAVGFLRRNLMVPVPEVASLAELNAMLMSGCVAMGTSTHWRKGVAINELFTADVAAGVALPGVAFDPVRYESRRGR